jgi:hypothetical protein
MISNILYPSPYVDLLHLCHWEPNVNLDFQADRSLTILDVQTNIIFSDKGHNPSDEKSSDTAKEVTSFVTKKHFILHSVHILFYLKQEVSHQQNGIISGLSVSLSYKTP